MKILNDAINIVKPTKEEEIILGSRIKAFMKRIKVKNAKIKLGGSGTKGTWLKDANDTDIYIQYNYNKYHDKSDKISEILEYDLKKCFKKLIKLHGSRDYFQVKENGFTYEIIPILDINKSNHALNITDVSPLHAKFVKGAIKKNKKLANNIRLLKQFAKANDIYGAESYISGFSGYMCELLVINYGGFLKLIKAVSAWKEKHVVDIKKFYKNKNIYMEMNKSKIHSPLILVDPVQKERNAGAALSIEKYNDFRKLAKKFVKKPSLSFFTLTELNYDKIKKDHIVISVKSKKGKCDVMGAKLLKSFEFIKTELKKQGFIIKNSGWKWNREKLAYFYFKIPKDADKIKIVKGPPVSIKEHVKMFKKKHKNTYIKNKVIYAKCKRKKVKAKNYIKELIKDDYVKQRVKSIEA